MEGEREGNVSGGIGKGECLNMLLSGEPATIALGRALGAGLRGLVPAMVALVGPLGAGKTHFTKGLAEGLGAASASAVRSPTFTLLHTYRGGGSTLHHVDFYRVAEAGEVPQEIGEALADPAAIVAAEWADLHMGLWPANVVRVELAHAGDDSSDVTRHATIETMSSDAAWLGRARAVIAGLKR